MSVVENLEKQLAKTKEVVARRDLVQRLLRNRDFQKLIMQDFIVNDAARLVGESCDPALTVEQRADALSMAQAAGHLKRYLSMAEIMGNNMERQVGEIEEAIMQERAQSDAAVTANDDDLTGDDD